jgi:hypothetical protein
MNTLTAQSDQFLSLRLASADAALVRQLHERLGLSKTEIVKQALRLLASTADAAEAKTGLYELGKLSFGRYGDITRQSAKIKSVVRDRLAAKQRRMAYAD